MEAKSLIASHAPYYTHTYHYTLSQPTQETHIKNLGTSTHTYDLKNRRTNTTTPYTQETIHAFDPCDNVLSYNDSIYTYDHFDQVSSEPAHTYTFDAHHNRVSHNDQITDYTPLHQLDTSIHTYDDDGNLVYCKSRSVLEGDTTYIYDALDRLIHLQNRQYTIDFTYDCFHRRLTKRCFKHIEMPPMDYTSHYIYDGQKEIGIAEPYSGNVYELCQDWYGYNYYEASAQEPQNPTGPIQGVYRVLRGGCWKSLKEDMRCSHRHRNNPGTVNGTCGFRCASDVT